MRVLVFGQTGQLATEIARRAPEGITLDIAGRDRADLEEPESLCRAHPRHAPEAVINAAAYTAVDRAEEEEDRATLDQRRCPRRDGRRLCRSRHSAGACLDRLRL